MDKSIKRNLFVYFLGSLILIGGLVLFFTKYYNVQDFLNKKRIENCFGNKDQLCYRDLIMDVFNKEGLEESLGIVNKIYAKDPSFSTTCHDIGHLLGFETYKLFKQGKPFKVSPEISFCSYGFYHGFMELLAGEGDVSKAQDFCNHVDQQMSKVTPDATLQCFHGIGHGWVNIHDNKTLTGDDLGIVNRGLGLCEKVSVSDSQLSRCATGVFNGLATFYSSGEYELKVRQGDPMWLCKVVDQKFQDPCYVSMNTVLFSITGQDLKVASGFVEQIKDDEIAKHAMINLALPFSLAESNASDHSKNIDICRSLQNRLVAPCIQGFAFGILEHGEPGKEYIKSIAFCKGNGFTKDETKECLSYIYAYLAQWYPSDKAYLICESEYENESFCKERVDFGLKGLTS